MSKVLFTSESVTEGHPDKICDQISDAVLDAYLAQDPMSRVACETCTTTGIVFIMGVVQTFFAPERTRALLSGRRQGVGNVLAALPKSAHPGAKKALAEIYAAGDVDHARAAAKALAAEYGLALVEPIESDSGVSGAKDATARPGYARWLRAALSGDVRQLADGQPLLRELVAREGSGVLARVLARLMELARVVPLMEGWLKAIRPGEPFCRPAPLPAEGQGRGLTEAARGALGHWIALQGGRIRHWQIIAPTSWNFSPRDAGGRPGALEQALEDAPVRPGETTPVAVQHIVRSFDPCMVCTVH